MVRLEFVLSILKMYCLEPYIYIYNIVGWFPWQEARERQ